MGESMTRAELLAAAEALEWANTQGAVPGGMYAAIYRRAAELRAQAAALEAPEPVAWCREWQGDVSDLCAMIYEDGPDKPDDGHEWTPLYEVSPDQTARIAELEGLLEDAEQGLRVLKTMLRIEHLPGGAAAAEKLIERIRAELERP